MSRILVVADDDRLTTWEACWWRLILPTNDQGYYAVTQIDIPETEQGPPWAGHIDYFDGRNDWSWPYEHNLSSEPIWEPIWGRSDVATGIQPYGYHLDVLDSVPPDVSETSRWRQLTEPGNDRRPTEREILDSWSWPKGRRDWIIGYCTSFDFSFMG